MPIVLWRGLSAVLATALLTVFMAMVPGAATQSVPERRGLFASSGRAKKGDQQCDTEFVPVSMPSITNGVANWEMCIHPPEQDIYLSKLLKQGVAFDPQVQHAITRVTARTVETRH